MTLEYNRNGDNCVDITTQRNWLVEDLLSWYHFYYTPMTAAAIRAKNGTSLTIGYFYLQVWWVCATTTLFSSVTIAGLPKALNTDLRNLHLITCSNEVSPLELAEGFISDLVRLETEGIAVYDAHLECEVLLIAPVLAILGDNPRALEVVSHMGSSANKFCRMCMVRWVCMCVNRQMR